MGSSEPIPARMPSERRGDSEVIGEDGLRAMLARSPHKGIVVVQSAPCASMSLNWFGGQVPVCRPCRLQQVPSAQTSGQSLDYASDQRHRRIATASMLHGFTDCVLVCCCVIGKSALSPAAGCTLPRPLTAWRGERWMTSRGDPGEAEEKGSVTQ
jgi:hypothetical protein